ncbi:MAG: hypothetical protein E7F33_10115 [Morganella morganii]|nr:hypothetical protein [Morganella morganii]
MGPIQGHQAIQTLNNDIYGSAGSNSSSSYVSSSGIKSVLLNAWNAVKSAVSGMLSSFGLHLSGQQGSDKPDREIVMDMSSRPAQPLPVDIQFDNDIYESSGGNVYDSVSSPGQGSLSSSLSAFESENLYEEIGTGQIHTLPEIPPPVNLSTHPSLSASTHPSLSASESEHLYEEIGAGQIHTLPETPPPVNLSTHPSLSRLPGPDDDI